MGPDGNDAYLERLEDGLVLSLQLRLLEVAQQQLFDDDAISYEDAEVNALVDDDAHDEVLNVVFEQLRNVLLLLLESYGPHSDTDQGTSLFNRDHYHFEPDSRHEHDQREAVDDVHEKNENRDAVLPNSILADVRLQLVIEQHDDDPNAHDLGEEEPPQIDVLQPLLYAQKHKEAQAKARLKIHNPNGIARCLESGGEADRSAHDQKHEETQDCLPIGHHVLVHSLHDVLWHLLDQVVDFGEIDSRLELLFDPRAEPLVWSGLFG